MSKRKLIRVPSQLQRVYPAEVPGGRPLTNEWFCNAMRKAYPDLFGSDYDEAWADFSDAYTRTYGPRDVNSLDLVRNIISDVTLPIGFRARVILMMVLWETNLLYPEDGSVDGSAAWFYGCHDPFALGNYFSLYCYRNVSVGLSFDDAALDCMSLVFANLAKVCAKIGHENLSESLRATMDDFMANILDNLKEESIGIVDRHRSDFESAYPVSFVTKDTLWKMFKGVFRSKWIRFEGRLKCGKRLQKAIEWYRANGKQSTYENLVRRYFELCEPSDDSPGLIKFHLEFFFSIGNNDLRKAAWVRICRSIMTEHFLYDVFADKKFSAMRLKLLQYAASCNCNHCGRELLGFLHDEFGGQEWFDGWYGECIGQIEQRESEAKDRIEKNAKEAEKMRKKRRRSLSNLNAVLDRIRAKS